MRTLVHTVLMAGVMSAMSMNAQTAPRLANHEVDLAVTYAAERSNLVATPIFWRSGGSFALSAELLHGFGVGVDINGSRVSNINGTGIHLTTITTNFGPRYQWTPRSGKFALFGEGLIGESHGLNSVFPSERGALTEYNSFSMQVGGGVDLRIGRRFAIRPLHADWIRTQFPNGTTNVQNSLRLGAGVVLRISPSQR